MTCKKCTTGGCPECSPAAPEFVWTPIKFGVKRDAATCRQCNGSKRVWVAGVGPHANPVKVVCGECAEG